MSWNIEEIITLGYEEEEKSEEEEKERKKEEKEKGIEIQEK